MNPGSPCHRPSLLLAFLRDYQKVLILGFLSVIAASGFALAIPWLLKEAIDNLGVTGSGGRVGRLALGIVLAAILQGLFRFHARMTMVGASRHAEYALRNRLLAHLLRLDPAGHARMTTGDLMARGSQDLSVFRTLIGAGPMHLAGTVLTILSTVTLMIVIDPLLTAAAVLPYPLLFAFLMRLKRRMQTRFTAAQEAFSQLSTRAQESLAGVRMVKAYTMERHVIRDFDRLNEGYLQHHLAAARLEATYYPLTMVTGGVGVVAVLALGGVRVLEGALTLGAFVAFNGYLAMLLWPTVGMAWLTNLYQRGRVAADRIAAVLATEPAICDPDAPLPLAQVRGNITIRHLTFTYPPSPAEQARAPALVDVTLEASAGEFVLLVGPVGGGKSTLLHLLLRLWEIPAGRIFLDGIDVTRLRLADLRGAIRSAPQDPFLFSETVRWNVAFGNPEANEALIWWALELAQFAEEVQALPQQLDTIIGERGVTLSGGQRQRLTLARALVSQPRVLLLDDALSNVDAETEATILQSVRAALPHTTLLLATHRLSAAVQQADRIVVLDGGAVTEVGTHATLLDRGGLYARLWSSQERLRTLEEVA
ncbi:MAG: ABC transporter ATP-binding protein [Candidatus Methylomirabilales bacterium]